MTVPKGINCLFTIVPKGGNLQVQGSYLFNDALKQLLKIVYF